jgi:peptide/nickel transport system ATP-binding protein
MPKKTYNPSVPEGNTPGSGQPIAEVKNLVVHYETDEGIVEAVNNVSFSIKKGEVLGLVGETGAGKTTIALSLMKLLPVPPAHVIQGEITLDGEGILDKSNRQMQKIRGNQVSMIFQDPMTALNPVKYAGDQIAEVILLHERCSRKDAMLRAIAMMETVGIQSERYKEYPHQFSGGMKQRIVIAMALACRPKLLIADEPTTALDVTIQAQVLDLMKSLQKDNDTATLMITHDFGIVAEVCDRCAVIYAGEIVEYGSREDIFDHAVHPYTVGLMESIPSLDKKIERLKPIPGLMIDPTDLPSNCSFCLRCPKKTAECMKLDPALSELSPGHYVKCICAEKGGIKTW